MMFRLICIGVAILLAASCSPDAQLPSSATAEKVAPNVVIVITDDQGYGDIGRNGNPVVKTPSIDRFAEKSMRLTNFHVDPTCSPTRAALMTGQHSMRAGVWHTIMGRSLLPTEKTTMAEHFQSAGYRTGLFGKWHLGDNAPFRPEDQGFETVVIHGGGGVGQTPDFWGNTQFDDTYYVNGTPKSFLGNSTDVWFDEAETFLQASDEKPSFAVIALNAPHRPWRAPDKYVEPYRALSLPEPLSQFYGMITHLDERFGELVRLMEAENKTRETILIFMTDNGSAMTFSDDFTEGKGLAVFDAIDEGWIPNAGMRGFKASVYDGGHRVPFYINLPGQEDGRDINHLTAHYDILPTLLELAGVSNTIDTDGQSLAPLLRGEVPTLETKPIVVTNQRVFNPSFDRPMAVLDGDWRLIVHGESNVHELFNLSGDPDQSDNVIDQFPDQAARMMEVLTTWWEPYDRNVDATLIPLGKREAVVRLTAMDWMEAPSTDDIPWFPGHDPRPGEPSYPNWIGREAQFTPLPWYVDFKTEGDYILNLRVHDKPSERVINTDYAIVEIGEDNRFVVRVDPGASEVKVPVTSGTGFRKLRAYFSNSADAETGLAAFYVDVSFEK